MGVCACVCVCQSVVSSALAVNNAGDSVSTCHADRQPVPREPTPPTSTEPGDRHFHHASSTCKQASRYNSK